jgi:hypothetical protein
MIRNNPVERKTRMNLRELLNTVSGSSPEDWHGIGCWGHSSGPSYHDHLSYRGQSNVFHVKTHSDVAVYIPDVSITMAYGLDIAEGNYEQEWVKNFPNGNARIHYVDVFFNNALVYRDAYVAVDGGGILLPVPRRADNGDLEVAERACMFVKLLDSMSQSGSEFDVSIKRAGFKVVDTEWPVLSRRAA